MTLVLLFAVCLLVSVLVSGIAARTVLSTSLVFLLAGTVIGQGGLGLVQLDANSPIVGTLADLALFTVLFVDGTALRTLSGCNPWVRWRSGSRWTRPLIEQGPTHLAQLPATGIGVDPGTGALRFSLAQVGRMSRRGVRGPRRCHRWGNDVSACRPDRPDASSDADSDLTGRDGCWLGTVEVPRMFDAIGGTKGERGRGRSGDLAVTRGFFDYEGHDDDEPRTFYERRVAKAKREGTWDKPPPLISALPKGAATATAVQSFWLAVTWATLSVARLVPYLLMIVTDPDAEDWVNAVVALIMGGVAAYYWRSWRILLAHEAEHGKPSVQEKADRRTKIMALVLAFAGVVLIIVYVVGW